MKREAQTTRQDNDIMRERQGKEKVNNIIMQTEENVVIVVVCLFFFAPSAQLKE